MKKLALIGLISIFVAQLCSAQQSQDSVHRVGDALKGSIKEARFERAQLRIVNGEVVEGSRVLTQIITYSEDGLRREANSYRGTTVTRKMVETFLPDGSRETMSVYNGAGALISKVGYESDTSGRLASEVQYQPDGSVKERKTIQTSGWPVQQVAVTKTSGTGTTIENSINTSERTEPHIPNSPAKRSVWTTTKADGSRTENIFEVDGSGNHNDQQLFYAADGSFTGKRVGQTDARVTRLEATEYHADGSVKNRSLHTREYDSHYNVIKSTDYLWNAKQEKFEQAAVSYTTITYR